MKPFGHGAPPSQPTQFGAPRAHTPQRGVPRAATPTGGVPQAPPPSARTYVRGYAPHPSPPAMPQATQYPQPQAHYSSHPPMPQPMPQAMPHAMPQPVQHPSYPPMQAMPQGMPQAMPHAMPHAYPAPLPPMPAHVLPQPAHQPTPPSGKKSERNRDTARKVKAPSGTREVGDPQLGFRFKLTFGDGHIENMLVDAERALIGSAAHCEVRLPSEIAAHEHVEVFAHEGAVHFATKPYARDNLPALDNVATMEGAWGTGSTLRIGDVSMTVELVTLGMAKAKPPIWALFVAIPAIALTAAGVALARPVDRSLPPVPEAPVLIGAKDGRCPDVPADQKGALATEKLRVALAKRERSPFAPQEGYEAVLLFETAAACFRLSGDEAQAKDSDEAADVLRIKLDEDYRLRRVRLEHAYYNHQVHAAKRELVVLIPLTAHKRGPYTEWLAFVDRAATIELQEEGRLAP